ncbi:Uu.00g076760.m01.CDS01 [Anthostomella pinea]|uniref:Uu.00g076760.m01.CDS01 n=1 Tax=Anthostomella pinea TaxID=933095 RepID=A0AAI8YPD6_9PEZI|nr:Uu.00g076760.m01.CDS01 [Anthostomella pinea]
MVRLWHSAFERDFFSIRRLWLFPVVAGSCWFTTLTILLIRWLAIGRPQYPNQVNPYVPFISDIAAQTFQPVFIVGCAVTGLSFFGTVFAVHHVRYSPKFYGLTDDAQWRQAVSMVALVAGLAGAVSLVLLSIFDTDDAHKRHRYLLMATFGGLFVSAVTTTFVWWDQARGPVVFAGLRKWCRFNISLVLCQFAVGIVFLSTMYAGDYRVSGIFEWILTYLGAFWLVSFVGYTRFREGQDPKATDGDERQPLLA